jgi:hypothetical protein
MKHLNLFLILTILFQITSCSKSKIQEKGFPVSSSTEDTAAEAPNGLNKDSLQFQTRPSNVLLTGVPNVRLTTIYKVNSIIKSSYGKEDTSTYIGSNNFHYRDDEYTSTSNEKGNNWNNHLMPGLAAAYGYNLVNVGHSDIKENRRKHFFEKPVLIKTLYYPSFPKDTLNFLPIHRDYFMISVYNEDTNKDGFINMKDLRRFYLFDINGVQQKPLIPENYSVFSSGYDSDNDLMFVFAQLDSNANGKRDAEEPIHIFWIDLKDPNHTGQVY